MTPAEATALLRVNPRTLARWADAGKIDAVLTLGGHRRYVREQIEKLAQVQR